MVQDIFSKNIQFSLESGIYKTHLKTLSLGKNNRNVILGKSLSTRIDRSHFFPQIGGLSGKLFL